MNYEQTLYYLYSQLPMYQRIGAAAYKKDLQRTLELDRYFSHPHKKFKSIHIAGTNGKGSVAHTLASILQEAGYKVGLYTSPHYLDFRERIRVNGQMIEKQFVIDFVQQHRDFFQSLRPSFFELTVAMAFQYFAEREVDYAVVEVGMGGRLDSTNIITPLVSVITNIGFDHKQFLGNTLLEIAREKAGIIKNNIPVVIGQMRAEIQEVFLRKTTEKNAPIFLAANNYSVGNTYLTVDSKLAFSVYSRGEKVFNDMKFGLLGQYQRYNIPVILQTVDVLKQFYSLQITIKAIYDGLEKVVENTGIIGRWQIISHKPLIVCDSAHNQDGIQQVIEQIKTQSYDKLFIIFGVVNDKDLNSILRFLPSKAHYYFVRASVDRAMPSKDLQRAAANYGLSGESFETVEQAIEKARAMAMEKDMIFVGGSTFVVADALRYFNEK